MVNTFGTRHPMPTPAAKPAHQERVNAEMFKAIELLGRKLERAENERDRLQRRLALIETAATVDEKTGKLYLPVTVDPKQYLPVTPAQTPRWLMASTFFSGAVAVLALGIVLLRPAAPVLTPEQIAVLNTLSATKLTELQVSPWKRITPGDEDSIDAATFLNRNTTATPEPEPEIAPEIAQEIETEPAQVIAEIPIVPITEPQFETIAEKPVAEVPSPAAQEIAKNVEPAITAPEVTEDTPPAASPLTAKTEKKETDLDIGRDKTLPEKLAEVEDRAIDGVPEAQHDLATLYAAGKVIGQDYKRAAYWFSKAADGGVANAHYNLGVMFQQGLGIKKDLPKAIGWYEKASELGHPEAMYNLGIAYIEGIGVPRNIDRGVSFFKRAANAGVAQAAFNLGILYESSFIGPVDLKRASEWYQVAANQGHAEANEALARIEAEQLATEVPIAANEDNLTLADMIEPAAGGEETSGQGDASPEDAQTRADAPVFKNDLIAKIQRALIRLGHLPGQPTGMMDPKTEDAIRAWQKSSGEKVDGIASIELLGKLTAQKK